VQQSTVDAANMAITYRGTVYPWECDHMGHMNVRSYVAKFDEATWQLFAMLGITPSYLREQNRGMAAVEQHITYKRELYPGDVITVRSAILDIREKVFQLVHEMRNDETGEITATTTLTGVHIDTQLRKACPFPPEIIRRGQEMVITYNPQT